MSHLFICLPRRIFFFCQLKANTQTKTQSFKQRSNVSAPCKAPRILKDNKGIAFAKLYINAHSPHDKVILPNIWHVPPRQTNQAVAVLTKKKKAAHSALSRRYSVMGQSSCNLSALFNGYIVEQSSLLIDKLATWLRFSRHNLKCGAGDWQASSLWFFEYFFIHFSWY